MPEEQGNPLENQSIEPIKNKFTPVEPTNDGPIQPPPFQQSPPFGQFGNMGQYNLPNATISLVLGILSIPGCGCCGILGLICGIIAWVLGRNDEKKYALNPAIYTLSSYKNASAGKICGIVGTSLCILSTIISLIISIIDPNFMKELIERLYH